jgi:shikimate dehydrogenase
VIARPGRLVLLGHPVAHSLSPAFQGAALAHAGIRLAYEALDVPPDGLDSALDALIVERGAGNVTIPHKDAVMRRCARLTPPAVRAGAVNTFWIDADGALTGDNTDVAGFHALLDLASPSADDLARVALIGAGGATGAVLLALEERGAPAVRVWNRTPARAHALAARFAPMAEARDRLDAVVTDATLVVNASPLGRLGEPWPSSGAGLTPGALVLDLAYAPGETAWVRAMRARGHRALDGREMLLAQGAASFERWFGVAPDRDVMRAALARAAAGGAAS